MSRTTVYKTIILLSFSYRYIFLPKLAIMYSCLQNVQCMKKNKRIADDIIVDTILRALCIVLSVCDLHAILNGIKLLFFIFYNLRGIHDPESMSVSYCLVLCELMSSRCCCCAIFLLDCRLF